MEKDGERMLYIGRGVGLKQPETVLETSLVLGPLSLNTNGATAMKEEGFIDTKGFIETVVLLMQ